MTLNSAWNDELLKVEILELAELNFDLPLIGFSGDELKDLLGEEPDTPAPGNGAGSLSDRFGIPPFSVLNAREGWWQDRKRAWLALGIQSELGRGGDLIPNGGGATPASSGMRQGRHPAARRVLA